MSPYRAKRAIKTPPEGETSSRGVMVRSPPLPVQINPYVLTGLIQPRPCIPLWDEGLEDSLQFLGKKKTSCLRAAGLASGHAGRTRCHDSIRQNPLFSRSHRFL